MSAVLRWATAGCVGAIALALVLVLVQPETAAQRVTETSLERSGVRVVEPATSSESEGAFDDAGSSLRLAAVALLFGLVAGVALGAAVERVGHLVLLALGGFVLAVAVLALADRATWRDVGAQAAFWAATAGWLWWSGRDRPAISAGSRPRP